MTPELLDLACEAVACPRWRWMAGMLTIGGTRLADHGERSIPPLHALPDFADPATVGCLEELVREALAMPDLYVQSVRLYGNRIGWMVCRCGADVVERPYPSRAAALVAALKGAP